ncbi:hypothetical protein H490_0109475 [Leucobacter sp. UCD-THU]|uniref:DUF6993 domain-containing protein n=1 Tax=Leucobacter sp. UCD-THU TaxID=1292023 RepID=UPI00037A094C|nr:hypothetical protein [Leucobacter sp. UCD-THU]EYT53789.1 hypothetical protein H490_0109475 [Leucobacter sp. UCD-THU]
MRSPLHSLRRPGAAFGALALTAALLAGCSLLEGPTPETPERTEPAVPETAPEFFPEGSAADNLPYFTEVLRAFAAGEQPVQGAPVVDAVAAAGFDKTAMQVSFDESQTGLAADSIFVSVRIGADCLIGQVVAEDRGFAAEAKPALGPAQDICLIGSTRVIDW